MMEKFDADGDGKLSESEKLAALKARLNDQPQFKEILLKRADANGDGQLDDSELAKGRFKNGRETW